MPNLYDPDAVRSLFDEMARTYGVVNILASFGFARLWRRQCLGAIAKSISPGADLDPLHPRHAIDLMTGMGELLPDLARLLGQSGRIVAIDISGVMCEKARRHQAHCKLEIVQTDVLKYHFLPDQADVIVCSFGLKTLSSDQIAAVAQRVAATLRSGGVFSFVEISVPCFPLLRWPYMFYLRRVVPLIGMLFMGNPDNYRMLGVYTEAFQNCREAFRLFQQAGLEGHYHSYFFGCATGFSGRKP